MKKRFYWPQEHNDVIQKLLRKARHGTKVIYIPGNHVEHRDGRPELLNSSVEAAIDRISFSKHGLSKRAKDYGSAAVMLAIILCGAIYALVAAKYYL